MGNIFPNPASVISSTTPVLLVDASGNAINSFGSASGTVAGPGSSTTNAISLFADTTGQVLKNSAILVNESVAGTSAVSSINNINVTSSGSSTVLASGTATFGSTNGNTTIRALADINLNSGFVAASGNVNINGSAGFVKTSLDIAPATSGTNRVGTSDAPFASTFSQQYGTPLISGVGGNVSVNWNLGTSQILNFNNIASGTYTVGLSNGIPGSAYVLKTIQNASGTVSLAWSGTQVSWQGGVSGTMTATSGTADLFSFWYDGNKYLGTFSNNYI